jgi:hypothetical protein
VLVLSFIEEEKGLRAGAHSISPAC